MGVLLAGLLVAGSGIAQPAPAPPPPETELASGEANHPAQPGGLPARVPVRVQVGCHPDAAPMTVTQAVFSVRRTPRFADALVSPRTVSHVVGPAECPDPDRTLELEATLVVGTDSGGSAFEAYPVHVVAEVRRNYRGAVNYTHGPYHVNATITQGFAPAVRITVQPSVARAPAGGTAPVNATIDNLSNGPAEVQLAFRSEADGDGAFGVQITPRTVTLAPGERRPATVEVTDERLDPTASPFAGKLLATAGPAERQDGPTVTGQATVKVHFEGPTSTGADGVPAPRASIVLGLLTICAAVLHRLRRA